MHQHSAVASRAVAFTLLFTVVTNYSALTLAFGEEPVDPRGIFDDITRAVGQGLAQAAVNSMSPLEFKLFEKVEHSVDGEAFGNRTEDDDSLARWLLGDVGLENEVQSQLITCVYVFCGTSDDLGRSDRFTMHRERVSRGADRAVLVLLRLEESKSVPSATIAAVVEVKGGQQQGLYMVRKYYDYRASNWVLVASELKKTE